MPTLSNDSTTEYSRDSERQTPKSSPKFQSIAYALPVMSVALLFGPIGVVQGIYAKHFGVTLTTIAAVLFVSRLFDALTDPLVGFFSDWRRARSGTRKPLILFGALFFLLSSYFLFVPLGYDTSNDSAKVSDLYFLLCFLAFYLGYTLIEIPHQAWGAELTADNKERNTIFSWRAAGMLSGALLFSALPLLPLFESNAYTPETLRWAVFAGGLLLLPSIYFCLKVVPNGRLAPTPKNNHRLRLATLLQNKPMLLYFFAYLLYGLAQGVFFGVLFIYVDSYLGLGEDYALVMTIGLCVGFLSIAAWRQVANRWGKKLAWILSKVLIAISAFMIATLVRGEADFSDLLWLILFFVGSAGGSVVSPALMSDLIDYSKWKFNTESTASYFSLYTLMNKSAGALGAAMGLVILGWYGFDPSAPVFSSDTAFVVLLSLAGLPVPLLLLSALLVALIPINTLSQHHLPALGGMSEAM